MAPRQMCLRCRPNLLKKPRLIDASGVGGGEAVTGCQVRELSLVATAASVAAVQMEAATLSHAPTSMMKSHAGCGGWCDLECRPRTTTSVQSACALTGACRHATV